MWLTPHFNATVNHNLEALNSFFPSVSSVVKFSPLPRGAHSWLKPTYLYRTIKNLLAPGRVNFTHPHRLAVRLLVPVYSVVILLPISFFSAPSVPQRLCVKSSPPLLLRALCASAPQREIFSPPSSPRPLCLSASA